MRHLRKAMPWLLGILAATLLFSALLAFANLQYIGSDDTPILRSFMGYEGGEPATFHLYLHTALAWLLWGSAKLFPGVAWFSILQLTFLWFSQAVVVKSLAQLSRRRGIGVWPGALAGVLFLVGFTVYVTARVSYTTTSALLGAAAVAQLASVDFTAARGRAVTGPVIGSALLLLAAYSLRQISVLPPLCFWLLLFAGKLLTAHGPGKRPWRLARPAMLGALAAALLFGLFAGVRALDIRLNRAEEFLRWQNERIKLLDYTDYDSTTTPETLAALGWSENEFTLFTYWYFMDDNISTAALETLNTQQTADDAGLTTGDRLRATGDTVLASLRDNPALRQALWAALAMAAAALCAAAYRRERDPWGPLCIVCAILGSALLTAYLGYTGRLPMRALASVLFPMAAYLFAAVFAPGLPPRQNEAPAAQTVHPAVAPAVKPLTETSGDPPAAPAGNPSAAASDDPPATRAGDPPAAPANAPLPTPPAAPQAARVWLIPLALGVAVALWMTVAAVTTTAVALRPTLNVMGEDALTSADETLTDLDAYAAQHPETLFITDLSLVSDHRLFPDTSQGVPGNVMFWGGYPARSPSWYRMLAQYGITELNAGIFLRDNVRVASTDPEPWPSLMAYVAEYGGDTVDWEYDDSVGYVNFFRLYP